MKDKSILITGGSSGIGYSLAEAFLHQGCSVAITGRNLEKLFEAEKKLNLISENLLAVQGDVSMEDDCRRLVHETKNKFGKIDVLVNNAGISMRSTFLEADLEVLRTLMNINFWGTVYCTKFALPYLLESRGSVVGISSIAGKMGLPARSGYSASKFAMEGFLETLRTENLYTGLHVLVVCPGFTSSNIRKTALSKDGSAQGESPRDESRMMSSEKVAEEIIAALEKKKRDLILSAEGKGAILLRKFFPTLIDKMAFNKMFNEKNSPLKK